MAVLTRTQKKRLKHEEKKASESMAADKNSSKSQTDMEILQGNDLQSKFNFAEDIFCAARKDRRPLTKSQKWQQAKGRASISGSERKVNLAQKRTVKFGSRRVKRNLIA